MLDRRWMPSHLDGVSASFASTPKCCAEQPACALAVSNNSNSALPAAMCSICKYFIATFFGLLMLRRSGRPIPLAMS